MDSFNIPQDFLDGPIWNNGKPFSESQAYIQFMVWASKMGDDTHFIHGAMITLKANEFIMPQRKIAESINWTQSAVSRYLQKLVKMNQCCINSESKMTRISLTTIEVTRDQDATVNQEANVPTSLADFTFGGVTNSTFNSTNSNNIKDNYSSTDITSTNSNNNNNISAKPSVSHKQIISIELDELKADNNIGVVHRLKSYKEKPKDVQMVIDYFKTKGMEEDEAVKFYNYYEMVNWFSGKTKIRAWRMAVNNWQRRSQEQPKSKKEISEMYKVGSTGDYLVFCLNKKCKNYGSTLFAKDTWAIKKGCVCGSTYSATRPILPKPKPKPVEKETYEEELISFSEFSKGKAESSARGGVAEGNSKHISGILDSLFQQG